MADLQFEARWSPDLGIVDLRREQIGAAGSYVIVDDHLRVVIDAASDEVRRIVIDLDAWADAEPDPEADIHGPLLGAGLLEQLLAGPTDVPVAVTVPGRDTLMSRLSHLGAALDVAPSTARDQAVSAIEVGALALGVSGALPGLADLAVERLWSVLADPDTATELAEAGPEVSRLLRPFVRRGRDDLERLGADGPLVVALDDLLARWSDDDGESTDDGADPFRGPAVDPTVGRSSPIELSGITPSSMIPAAAPPAPARSSAPPPTPESVPASAGAAGGWFGRRRARRAEDAEAEEADDFAVDLTDAAAYMTPPGPDALVDRSGDEALLAVPEASDSDGWLRVAARTNRVLLAAAPVRAARDGLLRLPIAASVPDHELLVDVVADPSLPVRDREGEAMRSAIAAGREAVVLERRGDLDGAQAAWIRSRDHWEQAGDGRRAGEAQMRAYTAQFRSPLLHERLPSAS